MTDRPRPSALHRDLSAFQDLLRQVNPDDLTPQQIAILQELLVLLVNLLSPNWPRPPRPGPGDWAF